MITGKTAKIVSKMGVGAFLESQSGFKSARVPKDVSKDVSRREGVIEIDTKTDPKRSILHLGICL